jgi:hypothetical protein
MKTAWPRWITPSIIVSYVALSNLALASQSRGWAAVAVALFVMLLVPQFQQARWRWVRIACAVGGIGLVAAVAAGVVPPFPLMLPPVVIPAALTWLFGHTLLANREALVERFARAVSAPEPLDAAHASYARGVTVMWTWVLALITCGNLLLVTCLVPGGLIDQFGHQPRWPVDLPPFLWLSNGIYILIPLILVAEFLFRLHRFPNYRLSNPLEFARRARERLPAVVEEVRRG